MFKKLFKKDKVDDKQVLDVSASVRAISQELAKITKQVGPLLQSKAVDGLQKICIDCQSKLNQLNDLETSMIKQGKQHSAEMKSSGLVSDISEMITDLKASYLKLKNGIESRFPGAKPPENKSGARGPGAGYG